MGNKNTVIYISGIRMGKEMNDFTVRLNKAIDEHWQGTYSGFVKSCGISARELDSYLFDGVIPPKRIIAMMARALDVSVDDLTGEQE